MKKEFIDSERKLLRMPGNLFPKDILEYLLLGYDLGSKTTTKWRQTR